MIAGFRALPLGGKSIVVVVVLALVVAGIFLAPKLLLFILGGGGLAKGAQVVSGARADANAARDVHEARTEARNDDRAVDQVAADRDVEAALDPTDELDTAPPVDDDDRARRRFRNPFE